ncbi:MAG: polymer-forming cytoskeletal protein [Anaerolineales bacterium]|nr:polymer-forming cytoskeletal protein [Anaerolineales bacterium]
MFTFKPAPKNGSANGNGHGNGNGHSPNGNGHSENGNGHGNGHSAPAPVAAEQQAGPNGNGNSQSNGNGYGNGNGHSNGNGQATSSAAPFGQTLAGWLGLSKPAAKANGHAPRRLPARKDNAGHRIDSVIGPGIHVKGTLTGAGGVRIDGTFDGSINIEGPLLITDGAKVTADVRAGAVSVGGSLKGDVVAGKVEILATGRIWGDLITGAFATEEGAFLRGQVRMEDELPPAPPEPEARPLPEPVMVEPEPLKQTI